MQRTTASAKFVLPQIATATGNLYFRLAFFKFWQIHPQNFFGYYVREPSPVSLLLCPVSHLLSPLPVYHLPPTVSRLMSTVSCLPHLSPVSFLPPPVSCLLTPLPLTCLLSPTPVSCLSSSVSHILSHNSCLNVSCPLSNVS